LRILVVTPCYHSRASGIEVAAHELAVQFARLGAKVSLVSRISGWYGDERRKNYASIIVHAWNPTEDLIGFPYPFLGPRSIIKLFYAVKNHDVIHIHDSLYISSIISAIFSLVLRKPYVITQHISEVPYKNPFLLFTMRLANRSVATWLLSFSRRNIFCSNKVLQYFFTPSYENSKNEFIVNGVDEEVYNIDGKENYRLEVRKNLELPKDKVIILFVGRFVEKKGVTFLKEVAFACKHFHFILIGQGVIDPYSWDLPNVTVFSSLIAAQLKKYYGASDFFIMPSVGEGFPLSVQEAMSCGLPSLIGIDTAGALEEPYHPDLIIDPLTAGNISEKLQKLLSAPDKLCDLQKWSLTFARSKWSWRQAAEKYLSVFSSLL
jgi:glycosyltransferase involved in cell wall biosynthesis